jgi:hypothetical protein
MVVPCESQPAIEDNALIGDRHTAALVAKDGSIDFLCLPDFDGNTCFASILGMPENGYWRIAPTRGVDSVQRRYRGNTLILETEFTNELGVVRLTDFMPVRRQAPRVVRIVEALRGEVRMTFQLRPRFAYGLTVPREISRDGVMSAIAWPDALYLRGGGGPEAPPFNSEHTLKAGERVAFGTGWSPDGRTMYHTESFRYAVFAYDFDGAMGAIANRRAFVQLDPGDGEFPDGLTVDAEGFVWSGHVGKGRIVRYDPTGRAERQVQLPVTRGTSCMFGGMTSARSSSPARGRR